jgi:predicted lactoylglutathione lyase
MHIETIIPILRVANLNVSRKYYIERLGFKLDWGKEPSDVMCSVSRDGHAIMLCQGEQGNPGTWVWIGVDDIKPLHEQFARDGLNIMMPPTNFSWAYEFRVADPDGHVLRFGSDALEGVAINDDKA